MSLNERVFLIVKDLDISDSEFSKTIGFSKQVISQWKSLEIPISAKALVAIIQAYPQYNPHWIISGLGHMHFNNSLKSGSIKIGNQVLDGSSVNETEPNYSRLHELEKENSRLKDELLKCKDQLIEILKTK
jgi:hypothetical protein